MSARSSTRASFALAVAWLALAPRAMAQLEDEDTPAETREASTEQPANGPEQSATPAQESEPAAKVERGAGARVEAFAGFGFGTRTFERPTPLGGQRLPSAYFPAVDVGLRLIVSPKRPFSLAVLLRYQTSLGMVVDEHPSFALANRVHVRAERGELSAAPTFRLGEAETAAALSFPIGAEIRTFWPDVRELMTPGYSLLGPHARAELIAPFGRALLLRFGPELQWIVAMDRSIRRDGVQNQGVAIGGEATLRLELSAIFALELCYRESHALASSTNGGPSFNDVERFLTGRISGAL